MTGEEAIKRLKEARNTIQPFLYVDEAIDYAIKALEQQSRDNNWKFYYDHGYAQAKRDLLCEDCISRAEALHACCDEWNKDYKAIMKSIRQLPSITPQQTRWISGSERLPKENISVIGTTKYDDIYETELYDDCGEKKWYADGCYDVPIVAWMPLPEPYKAESEE